jgi:hypothetical protein
MYYRKVKPIARSNVADETSFTALHNLQLELNIAATAPFSRLHREHARIHCRPNVASYPMNPGPKLRLRLVGQVIEVQDRVEYKRITPHRLSAIDRVVGEQQHIPFAQVGIHHDGMLGD